MAIQTE